MPASRRPPAINRLLAALPPGERRRMLDGCETVHLTLGEVLHTPPGPLVHVYFPTQSFISLIMAIDHDDCLEVGLVGSEGMFGVAVALGMNESPVRAMVQGAGPALRMDAARCRREVARSEALRRTLCRYAFVHLHQLAQATACTRFHVVEARLARWLLMMQDRAEADSFHVTQEFLAFMLGVRRVGVTKAANSLLWQGHISYHRGDVKVLNRRGLRAAACGCYEADRDAYARILG